MTANAMNLKARREQRYEWLRSLKNKPCADCGEIHPPDKMEWDHLPKFVKVMNVSRMTGKLRPIPVIKAEIAKCELVCVWCHRKRTIRRRQGA